MEDIASGENWREERTGLNELEFIETRRHWFTGEVMHHTEGIVNVLNLVEGREVIVESPTHAFEPSCEYIMRKLLSSLQLVGAYTMQAARGDL